MNNVWPGHTDLTQNGFTLLEVLVSMSIGALIMIAATGLTLTSAESRKAIKHSAELQEEAYFVTHVLKQQLAQAGFRGLSTAGSTRSLPINHKFNHFPAVTNNWRNGQLIRVVGNSLIYRFDGASLPDGTPDGSIYDCLGNPVAAGTIVESTISLQGNSLLCTVGTDTTLLIGSSQDTRVEQMDITLGIDNNNDGKIDRTIRADSAADADFAGTRHITIRLLIASRDNAIKHHQTYYFNGAATATDHRLRVEAVVSAALRH